MAGSDRVLFLSKLNSLPYGRRTAAMFGQQRPGYPSSVRKFKSAV